MTTWVTDLTDLPPAEAQIPAAGRARADFTIAVVEAATSRPEEGELWLCAVRCIGGARCTGRVEVRVAFDEGEVHWYCARCGDDGVVRGWLGSEHDLSNFARSTVYDRGGSATRSASSCSSRRAGCPTCAR